MTDSAKPMTGLADWLRMLFVNKILYGVDREQVSRWAAEVEAARAALDSLPAAPGAAVPAEQKDARPFPEGWKSAAEKPPAPVWYERRYSDGIYAHWWSGEQWSATKDGNAHWRQLADAPYPLWRPVSTPSAPPVQPGEREHGVPLNVEGQVTYDSNGTSALPQGWKK